LHIYLSHIETLSQKHYEVVLS